MLWMDKVGYHQFQDSLGQKPAKFPWQGPFNKGVCSVNAVYLLLQECTSRRDGYIKYQEKNSFGNMLRLEFGHDFYLPAVTCSGYEAKGNAKQCIFRIY